MEFLRRPATSSIRAHRLRSRRIHVRGSPEPSSRGSSSHGPLSRRRGLDRNLLHPSHPVHPPKRDQTTTRRQRAADRPPLQTGHRFSGRRFRPSLPDPRHMALRRHWRPHSLKPLCLRLRSRRRDTWLQMVRLHQRPPGHSALGPGTLSGRQLPTGTHLLRLPSRIHKLHRRRYHQSLLRIWRTHPRLNDTWEEVG